jgi:hypothetical protein
MIGDDLRMVAGQRSGIDQFVSVSRAEQHQQAAQSK